MGLFFGGDTSQLTSATNEDRARAADFYRQLAMLQQQYQQQLAAQNRLGSSLDRTIAGQGPSVAVAQEQRGVGQIQDAARASAAGAGGNNAALANYGAIQAAGAAQAKANQDAAALRAQEVAAAQAAKAQLLNNQQQATQGQYATNTGGLTNLSGTAMGGAGKLGELNQKEIEAERALASNTINAGGSALTAASDENKKTDKQPIAGNEMEDFLKHIAGFSFKYKPEAVGPDAPPGNRVGEMAQDVQKGGKIGRMVSDGKSIDLRNAVGALLAAVSHVNKKIEARR